MKWIKSESSFDNTLNEKFIKLIAKSNLWCCDINIIIIVKTIWTLMIFLLFQSINVVFNDFIVERQVFITNIKIVINLCMNFMSVWVQIFLNLINLKLIKEIQADLILVILHELLDFKHIIQKCMNWEWYEQFSSIINFVNVETMSFKTEIWTKSEDENRLEIEFIYEEQQHDKTDL